MGAHDGYFPRGSSVLRMVHEERAVGLLYGQRALMIGALNPLAYAGTALHTAGKTTPFQRLSHTAKLFEAIFFGSRVEADAALAHTHRLHDRVKGDLPEPVGPHPAGTAYSAYDPELMLWTMAVACESAETLFETLVRPLSAAEKEGYWADYVRFGELFGMPREVVPPTHVAFRAWWEDLLASDRVFLSEEARIVGFHVAFRIPMPRQNELLGRPLLNRLLLGTLSARVRELYGLRWTRADAISHRALVEGLRRSRPLVPTPVRRGSCGALFDQVARTERARLRAGRPTIPVPIGG